MPGDHVGEQTDGQRCGADQHQLAQLDRRQQDVHRPRHSLGEALVADVAPQALLACCGDPVLDEHPDREHQRHDHCGGGRHVHTGDDAAQVEHEDREEQRRNHRHVTLAAQLAHDLIYDAVAHEVDAHLDHALPAAGDELGALRRDTEHHEKHHGRHDADQYDAIDREGGPLEQDLGRKKIIDRWQFGTAVGRQ